MNTPAPTRPIALVTGASSGIGACYADRLARRGHDLILLARDETRLRQQAERIGADSGVAIELLRADLTERRDLERLTARIRDDAAIDLVVNNAGIATPGPLLGADLARVDAMLALNVVAATHVAIASASAFAARGHGTLINIGSVVALLPERFNGAYSGGKAHLLNLSQALEQEAAPHGVRVQAVLPGATRTEIWQRAGVAIASLPAQMLMDVGDLVDAALAGLDQGERVTIPSLPDPAQWERYAQARLALAPDLSRDTPAARYRVAPAAAEPQA
ncbi:MAG TPA: SDR family oxidoreductase [Dokdonella sp.]|uniref:SDR family NAD(P)-dependent oxidoreductase n=1 Tax=Dokdonella sp. TaxID=2291710 RepID=UPI002B91D12A|nr:SDR family oxidoreductase [Dokdonella sp.]HUD43872.1 SDR family oxidoreductase [Dokdonella sp.]